MSSSNNSFNSSSSNSGGNDKSGKKCLEPIYSANAYNLFCSKNNEVSSNNPWTSHSQYPKKNESQTFGASNQGQTTGLFGAAQNQNSWGSSYQESNKAPNPFGDSTGYEMFNTGRPFEQHWTMTANPNHVRSRLFGTPLPLPRTSSLVQRENEKNEQLLAQYNMSFLQPSKK